jgi:hypothetical protein
MWPRNNCRRVAMVAGGLGLTAVLGGCGEMSTSQGPKTRKTPQPQAVQDQVMTRQVSETPISEVDLQGLEVLRALRDSWAMKRSKVVTDPERE